MLRQMRHQTTDKETDRANKTLWGREPKTTVTVAITISPSKGRIVATQLDLQRRVDRSTQEYGPVAERILPKMLYSEGH